MRAFLLGKKPEILVSGPTYKEVSRRQIVSEVLNFIWERGHETGLMIPTRFGTFVWLKKKK